MVPVPIVLHRGRGCLRRYCHLVGVPGGPRCRTLRRHREAGDDTGRRLCTHPGDRDTDTARESATDAQHGSCWRTGHPNLPG